MSAWVCTVLRSGGHQPMPVFDAMQVQMAALRSPAPQAIVLDINLPGGTGMSALARLKASVKTSVIPVLVLSATTDPAVPAAVVSAGAAAFLAKPTTPEALLAAVGALG